MQLIDQQTIQVNNGGQPSLNEALRDEFKKFVDTFKDGTQGFVYKNALLRERVPLQLMIEDLPPGVRNALLQNPISIREQLVSAAAQYAGRPVQCSFVTKDINSARLVNEMSSELLDKLVSVRGMVIGSSKTRPKTKKLVAVCRACNHELSFELPFGLNQIQLPSQCQRSRGNDEQKCPNNSYQIAPQRCTYVDCQVLKLSGDDRQTLSVFLEGNLVDQDLIAGQHIVATGVLRQSGLVCFGYYQTTRQFAQDTQVTEQAIRQFAANNPLQALKQMIAPHLHGLEDLKLAIACQLVSGTTKLTAEKTRLRGEINILMLADPGVGKSELLKTAQLLSKVAVNTSGRGTSAAGLTAAVIRDSATGEFVLEGGALVLADGGLLCIDEFDKCRPDDVVSLHEAMEQGTVSVNKAGVQSVLSTRVSVLAAANPSFGRYDELQGLSEQVDIQATIASRFDLIFFMRDVVDSDRDARVVEKFGQNLMGATQAQVNYSFLRAYFESCRKIQTQLSEEAGNHLTDFYIRLRKTENNLAVTVRQLEALVRLSEAIAKLHQRKTVLLSDAEEAITLFKRSTGDAAAVGLQETLGKQSAQMVAEAQRLFKELMPIGQLRFETQLIQDVRATGISEGTAAKALSLMISSGDVTRDRGKMLVRTK